MPFYSVSIHCSVLLLANTVVPFAILFHFQQYCRHLTQGKGKGIIRYTRNPRDCRGRCWSSFPEADSPQMTLVINPAVGCHCKLSTRPAVTFPASECHCPYPVPIYTAWWTAACVCTWTTGLGSLSVESASYRSLVQRRIPIALLYATAVTSKMCWPGLRKNKML